PPVGRTLGFLALAVLVAFPTLAAAQWPGYNPQLDGSSVIVPGYAIGPYSLDLSVADFLWNHGQTRVRLNALGPQFRGGVEGRFWWDLPVEVLTTAGDNAVLALGSPSSDYATRQHIGVGSEEAKVTSTYGKPSAVVLVVGRPKVLIYDTLGVAFQIAYNLDEGGYGAVNTVFVFRPGQAAVIWRTP
ncbi:MAG TPA: hypothetical protein VHM88_20125, partial [Candidatus Acidoferrales bacterium]|nr:hypothetical protein [Candidatus Acidoferrales bacterium]